MSSIIDPNSRRAKPAALRIGQSAVVSRIEDEMRVTAADFVDSVARARLKVSAARYKVEGEVRQNAGKLKSRVTEAKAKLGDEARFLKS